MQRVLKHKGEEQIYNKARNHNETCSRDYNSRSGGTLPRDIRALVTENYDSVDCDSCHPSCMITACRVRNVDMPQILIDVVPKKNEIRQGVAESEGVSLGK